MSTTTFIRNLKGVLAAAVCSVALSSCSDLASTGTGPAYLIMESVSGAPGSDDTSFGSSLLSDVVTIVTTTVGGVETRSNTVWNDLGRAVVRAEMKNSLSPTEPSALNSVTINRYHVKYFRTDGRNTPGVDVPFPVDGATTITVPIGGTAEVGFDLVRHQAKLEQPLITLRGGRGLSFLSAIAEVTLYGRDQAGNDYSISGRIDVRFADFGDE